MGVQDSRLGPLVTVSGTAEALAFYTDVFIAPTDPQLVLKRAPAAGAEVEPATESPEVVLRDPAGQRWALVGATRTG
ncbi:hypothetical protein OOK41_24695 [Micromonospora sp. NBC_01655]|uniref:hypothetical protein n=1 Tax=Micromonospora sp. NBC_01655 TaxID=2975983 RepID=UPI002256922B|nr:hypothetical protein [Micromonospora sp. NBC_01655]MCX4473466.1 hypothetical protein [Micromonospora sp. NBC_01655]